MKYSQAKKRVNYMRENLFTAVKDETGHRYYFREVYFNRKGRHIPAPYESGKLEDGTIKGLVKVDSAKIFAAPSFAVMAKGLESELNALRKKVRATVQEGGFK